MESGFPAVVHAFGSVLDAFRSVADGFNVGFARFRLAEDRFAQRAVDFLPVRDVFGAGCNHFLPLGKPLRAGKGD
jgi:hypothetical protein